MVRRPNSQGHSEELKKNSSNKKRPPHSRKNVLNYFGSVRWCGNLGSIYFALSGSRVRVVLSSTMCSNEPFVLDAVSSH